MTSNAKAILKMAERTHVRFSGKKDSVSFFLKVLDSYMRRFRATPDSDEYQDEDLIGTFLDGTVARWFFAAYDYTTYDKFKIDLRKRWGRTIKSALIELQNLKFNGGDAHDFIESLLNLAEESELDCSSPKDLVLLEEVLIRAVPNQQMAMDLRKLYTTAFDELADYFIHLSDIYFPTESNPRSTPLPYSNSSAHPPPILKTARFEPQAEQPERWRNNPPYRQNERWQQRPSQNMTPAIQARDRPNGPPNPQMAQTGQNLPSPPDMSNLVSQMEHAEDPTRSNASSRACSPSCEHDAALGALR